jgi:hypothetical protein
VAQRARPEWPQRIRLVFVGARRGGRTSIGRAATGASRDLVLGMPLVVSGTFEFL